MSSCALAEPQPLAVGDNACVEAEQLAATETRTWSVCLDHGEWVQAMASKYFPATDATDASSTVAENKSGTSRVLEALVNLANRETKEIKRMIFRKIRCLHCKQGGHPGGNKTDIELTLPAIQLQWLRQVAVNCEHESIDKTMRIILDFYPSLTLLKDGEALERKLFADSSTKSA